MKGFGVFVAGCMAASFSFGVELVRNGGFEAGQEGRADSWWLPPHFKAEANVGLNGNRGISWENGDPTLLGEWVDQKIAVKPGVAYRMSCWARCENLGGEQWEGRKGCATLILTVSDKNGKYLCEHYAKTIRGTQSWTKLEGQTGKMPPDAATIKVSPFVWHKSVGKVWFDEVSVEPIEAKPVGGFWSSAYRDTAWEGEVSFYASLGIDESATPLDGLAVSLAYSDGAFGTKRIKLESFSASEARVTVPVASLPLGTFPISLEVWKKESRKLLAEQPLLFTRTATAPNWKCRFDAANRLIVDGKPFFPLGVFDYGAGDQALANVKKGPFNCIMPYEMLSKERWDAIHASGLRLIATMKDFMPHPQYSSLKMETQGDADRALLCRFGQLKDHPALLCWYMNDESSVGHIPRLERQYRLVRERDPDHPAYAVLCRKDSIRDYSGTCDVLGTDPYPINNKPIGTAAEFARETARAFFGRPMWQVPQAFAWKWFQKKEARTDTETSRMPTRAEMRSMTWQHLANGANGIVYYCFGTIMRNLKGEEFDRVWGDVCEVAREVDERVPVLLSDPAPNASGYPAGVSGRMWTKDGVRWLLAVNETVEPQTATLTLSGSCQSVKSLMDAASERLKGSVLSLALPPLGVAMFEVR